MWPEINDKVINESEIKMVIQINGKTRDILNVKRDLKESTITNLVKISNKTKKYFIDKKVVRTIFVENKIINYILNK